MSITMRKFTVGLAVLALASCVDHNQHALEIGAPPVRDDSTVVSVRNVQSRVYDTLDHEGMIQAATATLQDLGFTVENVSTKVGVLTGSKERDAVETGQVAGQVALVILAALAGSSHTMTYDETQKINVSVLVGKIDDHSSQMRVFFDRHITNNLGQLWKADLITEPEIYQQFFDKFSQSAFIEENNL